MDEPVTGFGIDTDKMVDRALAGLAPHIDRVLATFTSASSQMVAAVDALRAEQLKTNELLRQILKAERAN